MDERPPELIALVVNERVPMDVRQSPRRRTWMEGTSAGRCLPLLMANEAGWTLHNPYAVELRWDGGPSPADTQIRYLDGAVPAKPVLSIFGHGIVTWSIPMLFRTTQGYNLLARGPANWPRDGLSPLEGLVETDWSPYTFTMNWKVTRPGHIVPFEAGAPFCMLVPQRRGELEAFRTRVGSIDEDPKTRAQLAAVGAARRTTQIRKFVAEQVGGVKGVSDAWDQVYFRGRLPDGEDAPAHQTKLRLGGFDPERS